MTVELEVTEAQALTLQAMFEEWNYCSSIGTSKHISFMVDGDGNFHPHCKVSFGKNITQLNDAIRHIAKKKNKCVDISYDFDGVAWYLKD